jgi:hypothetical protein
MLSIIILLSVFVAACSDSEETSKRGRIPIVSSTQPASTVILACAKKENGQLRIVADHSECRPSEDPIAWNAAGPAGPTGPAGPQGPQGSDCQPVQYQLVGFSAGASRGSSGVLQLSTLCQATYPESRICTADEVVKSVTFPTITSSATSPGLQGWVMPTSIGGRGMNMGYDITTGLQNDTENLTCNGWSETGSTSSLTSEGGLAVSDRGQFRVVACSNALKVACCAPIKIEGLRSTPSLPKPK